jgi:hypothetical protein
MHGLYADSEALTSNCRRLLALWRGLAYNHDMAATTITEGEILERIISPKNGKLPTKTARSFLELRFPPRDIARIRKLLQKNNAGTITAAERTVLDMYLRVGQFLDLLHAKARVSLAKPSRAK